MIAKTQNEAYGFYGTIKSNYGLNDKEADQIWTLMSIAIVSLSLTENVQEVLDSANGRHIADEMSRHCQTNPTVDQLKGAITPTLNVPWVKRCLNKYKKYGTKKAMTLKKII